MASPNESDSGPKRSWSGFGDKTLWDWFNLLIVPAVLAFGAIVIEERFRAQQLEIEAARMRAANTEAFVDKVAELVIHANLKGDPQDPKVAAAQAVAQSRSNLVLEQLDLAGRLRLVYFLLDMALVQRGPGCRIKGFEERKERIVSLAGVDLASDPGPNGRFESHDDRYLGKSDDTWAELTRKCLNGADLRESDLRGAHLSQWMRKANLLKADLQQAKLRSSDLSGAFLRITDLRGANLARANLSDADLIGADLRSADLASADVAGAKFFVNDPKAATPHDPAGFIDFRTGKNSGAVVEGVDFGKVKNVSRVQRTYLCRNGAIGLDCKTPAP